MKACESDDYHVYYNDDSTNGGYMVFYALGHEWYMGYDEMGTLSVPDEYDATKDGTTLKWLWRSHWGWPCTYAIYKETLDGVAPDSKDVVANQSVRVKTGVSTDSKTYYLETSGTAVAGINNCLAFSTLNTYPGFTCRPELSDGDYEQYATGNRAGSTYIWFHNHASWDTMGHYEYGTDFKPMHVYFTRNQYHVYFDENGGADLDDQLIYFEEPLDSYNPSSYVKGTTKKTTADGQVLVFDGWYTSADFTGDEFVFTGTTMPSTDVYLYAKWSPLKYTVTFDSNGGSEVAAAEGVEYGTPVAKPTDPTRDGYIFLGWTYVDANGNEHPWNFSSAVKGDMTLTAQWRSDEAFAVRYDANGGSGTVATDTSTYYEGAGVKVLSADGITPPAGKVFLGWRSSVDGKTYFANGIAPMGVATEGGDSPVGLVLTAQWGDVASAVQLTYDFNYGTFGIASWNTEDETSTVSGMPDNQRLSLADFSAFGTAPDGWTFAGWYLDAACTDGPYTILQLDSTSQASENVVYAKWVTADSLQPTSTTTTTTTSASKPTAIPNTGDPAGLGLLATCLVGGGLSCAAAALRRRRREEQERR